ncbi:MAG: homoserine dehydrogenase, partial [Olpidium bornovanus]
RKVTILARLAGLSDAETSSLDVASLVPKPLENAGTAEEFMNRLPEFDDEFARKAQDAAERGHVLRYVGFVDVEKGVSGVRLESYPPTHPFAALSGSDNIIAFTTDRFPSPLVIRGAGAGAAVTAFGVLSDIFKVLERVC